MYYESTVSLILEGGSENANQQKRNHKRNDLAKTGGYELTKEEAETYLAELADYELDSSEMKNIAGGKCYMRTDLDDWFCPDRKGCSIY